MSATLKAAFLARAFLQLLVWFRGPGATAGRTLSSPAALCLRAGGGHRESAWEPRVSPRAIDGWLSSDFNLLTVCTERETPFASEY